MTRWLRTGLFVLISLAVCYYSFFYSGYPRISYEELKVHIEADQVASISAQGSEILIKAKVIGIVRADITAEQWAQIWPEIRRRDIALAITSKSSWRWILGTLAIFGIGYMALRFIEGQLQFWRARRSPESPVNQYLLSNKLKRTTFKDVALPDQALIKLKRVVEFLREPQKYQKLGGEIEQGFLLVGPTGIGKTLAALALAGEANVPCFWLSDPPSNVSELQALFKAGAKNAPALIFIDNVDSIVQSRSIWPDLETQNLEIMATALMSFFDRRPTVDGVVLVAATNRLDRIDEALIRPGRMDLIELSYPSLREAEQIFKVHTLKIPLAEDVDFSELVKHLFELCPQCTGATIAETCNLAVSISAETSAKVVNQQSFLKAIDQMRKRPNAAETPEGRS